MRRGEGGGEREGERGRKRLIRRERESQRKSARERERERERETLDFCQKRGSLLAQKLHLPRIVTTFFPVHLCLCLFVRASCARYLPPVMMMA